jgi:hypothetical protein
MDTQLFIVKRELNFSIFLHELKTLKWQLGYNFNSDYVVTIFIFHCRNLHRLQKQQNLQNFLACLFHGRTSEFA